MRRRKEVLLRAVVTTGCAIVVGLLGALLLYLLVKGVPHLTWQLLVTQRSDLEGTIGILPNLLSTLYVIGITLALAMPIGIGGGIYLQEYAPHRRFAALAEFAAETLAGIPSILYGLVGYLFFVAWLGRACLLAGGFTLAMMVLPTILRTTQEALKTVPKAWREGAIGLGASRWYLIRTIVLPSATDGILGGMILAVGRIVGESAALLLTAGMGYQLVPQIGKALLTSGGTLSVMLYVYVTERGEYGVGFAIGLLLVGIVLALNGLAHLCKGRWSRRGGERG